MRKRGGLELSIERGGVHTLEAMVLARYWMFTQVYYHKTRRIYDIYLSEYLKAWYSNQYENLLGVLEQDDLTLMAAMRDDAKSSEADLVRQKWARRILNRQHHRVVFETTDHAQPDEERVAVRLKNTLIRQYPNVDFIIDLDARGTVHKFYVQGEDEEMGEEFPIYDSVSGTTSRLSVESRIFKKVPKRFRVIRIYGDVPKDAVREYREFAHSKAKQFKEEI